MQNNDIIILLEIISTEMKSMKRLFLLFIFCFLLASNALADEIITDKEFNLSIKNGDIDFVRENISKIKDINSSTCFLCSAARKKQNEILDLLLENKADPNCPKSTVAPLYSALVYDNNYAVEKLLNKGADPNLKTNPPLIYIAIVNDNAYAVKKLLEAGVDSNVTFMKMKAITLAFSGMYPEIEEAYINHWNSRFDSASTDINEALELLKNSKTANKYYKILTGDNPSKKPFKILFCDIEKVSQGKIKEKIFEKYNSYQKQNYIYLDNDYRNISAEILAAILAGESINTDGKTSMIEQLVTFGIMGNVWSEFISQKPEINDLNNPKIKGLNGIIDILNSNSGRLNKGDYNNLWIFSGLTSTQNETSKGFKDKNLNVYFK